MPKKLDDCVQKVKEQGKTESEAYAICVKSTGYKRTKDGWKKTDETNKTNTPKSFLEIFTNIY